MDDFLPTRNDGVPALVLRHQTGENISEIHFLKQSGTYCITSHQVFKEQKRERMARLL